jgi:GntR family transcriptional regulator
MGPPLYQQIADDLRSKIESGELPPGQQIPTESDLQKIYGASRNTIRDAIKRLVSLGIVQTRAGQGTFVVGAADPFVTTLSAPPGSGFGGGEGATYLSQIGERHRSPRASLPKVEVQVPPPEIGLRLRIGPGAQVVSRHQERFIDETPWSLQTSFYPMEFALKAPRLLMAGDIIEGAMGYLEEAEGIKQVGYRDWITARTPNPNEQSFFGLEHDAMVFEIFRTTFDATGSPVRVTATVFPADRNQFIVNFGVVPEPQYDLPWPDDQTDPGQPDPHESLAEPQAAALRSRPSLFSWPNSGDHPSSED